MPLGKGEFVTRSVVKLVSRGERHYVGVMVTTSTLANLDTDVVDPATTATYSKTHHEVTLTVRLRQLATTGYNMGF